MSHPQKWLRKIPRFILISIGMITVITFLKLFCLDSYRVPTDSMDATILPGDYIVATKLVYGPKWPDRLEKIPWINLFKYNDALSPYFETKWSYRRWPVLNKIKRDDILIFESNWDDRVALIKRCKGLPGEQLTLIGDSLIVNSSIVWEPVGIRYTYRSNLAPSMLAENKNYNPITAPINTRKLKYQYSLHPDSAARINNRLGYGTLQVEPYLEDSTNNFGPIIVPKKGMAVNIYQNPKTARFYLEAIKHFEGASLSMHDGHMAIDGKIDSTYIFKYDYYFMMGDHRHSSEDSRYWGFVNEQSVIGKAIMIWYSSDPRTHTSRWDRTFSTLN